MAMPESTDPGEAPEQPDNEQQPTNGDMPEQPDGAGQEMSVSTGEVSTVFTLTDTVSSFSGLTDSTDVTGETHVIFTVNGGDGIDDVTEGEIPTITSIEASVDDLDDSEVQITLRSVDIAERWNVSNICSLSDGMDAIADLFYYDDEPITEGSYQLTVAVVGSNETYTGVSTFSFRVLAGEA